MASLIDRLPSVRGRLTPSAPLAPLTWFRVGGPAEALFKPADPDDLAAFMKGCPTDIPITVIGVASNLLVRDGGIPGVVIRLARGFTDIIPSPLVGEGRGEGLRCGAGALDLTVAQTACEAGIGGLEFLSGIPGTIGGAVRMNAGAYGREIVDVIVAATAIDRQGNIHTLSKKELGLTYRHSAIPEDWIVTEALLQGHADDASAIAERMAAIQKARSDSQPIRARTGGSTFANPPGAKAWELIDKAGCRGLRKGDAQISEKHCNFLLNLGQASATDIEDLGEDVRRRVRETSGIDLRWEIKRVGVR